ncbi:MAG: XrtA/PEP-CTERM system TPR-repeat protein PrsT [Rhodospirillaceae bacterium]
MISAPASALLFALTGAAAATTDTTQSQSYLAAAEKASQKGDFGAAVIELKNAIRADANNSTARYELAILYLRSGSPATALQELETARSHGFDEAKLALPLAQCYLILGRFRDALTKIDATKLQGDNRAAVLAVQSRAAMALNEPDTAHKLIDEALKLSPTLTSALVASGMMLSSEGKIAEAEAQLAKAREDKGESDLFVLRGELRQKQNDLAGAMKNFNLAVKESPNSAGPRIERATLNIALGDLKAVEDDVAAVLAREPKQPFALYLRAFLLASGKKYRDASDILLSLPQLLENYPPASYLLASTALEDGRLDIALDFAQRYVKRRPDGVSGSRLLAMIQMRRKLPALAVAILEPLAARNPSDNALKLQFAAALLDVGRSAEAIDLFQQGLAVDPNNAQARLALATGQLRLGQTDQGVAQIEKIIKSDPASIQANTLLVLTQLQTGQPENALRTATAMVKAKDADPNAYNLQGTAYLANHDNAGARTAFQTALAKDPKFVPAALNLARVEERSGNWSGARKLYEGVIATRPENVTAYEGMATLSLRNNDVDEASTYLRRAIARDSLAAEPRLRLIDMLLEHKRTEQALIEARDFANIAPKSPQAMDALGRIQIASGDMVNAVGSYQRLVSLIPDSPDAQRRLGRVLMTAAGAQKVADPKYIAEARGAFDHAVASSPEELAVLADRLEFERRAGGPKAALALAQQYADAKPDSVARMILLGDAQAAADQAPAALLNYRRAWDKIKTSVTTLRVYAGLTRVGKTEEALKLIKDWVAGNPTDYAVRFLIASNHIAAGRTDEAIAETESIRDAFPDNPLLLNNLAWLYSKRDPAKAIGFAERAYTLAPQSPDVLDTLGWLQTSMANPGKGEPLLKKAYDVAPTRNDIGYHYAVALEKSNKPVAAREVLEKALSGDAKFPERPDAMAMFARLGGPKAK